MRLQDKVCVITYLTIYLASDESTWTNGAALVVDGGITSNYF